MGLSQSSFVPECSCELEHLTYSSSAIHKHQFCPLCKRVLSQERRKKVQDIYRKHQSLNDSMFRRRGKKAALHTSSLPNVQDISSNPRPILQQSFSSSPESSLEKSKALTIHSTNSLGNLTSTSISLESIEPFSPLTRKLKSNSSKNLVFLSNGGKLPDKSVLRLKRNTTLPSLSHDDEQTHKIAINFGRTFQNHGTKSLPIYVIPPQEPAESANARNKSLSEQKSQKQEKKMKRKVQYYVVSQ